jgi:four helix bundle protein
VVSPESNRAGFWKIGLESSEVGDFRKLEVWRRSQQLARTVYLCTENMPQRERYGLTAQMRASAVSVSSNIAEGCGRRGDGELRRFLRISLGSLAELECQTLLALDLGMLAPPTAGNALLSEICQIRGMLEALHRRLRRTP